MLAAGCGRRALHHCGVAAACNKRAPRRSKRARSNHWDASGAARICISHASTPDGMASICAGRNHSFIVASAQIFNIEHHITADKRHHALSSSLHHLYACGSMISTGASVDLQWYRDPYTCIACCMQELQMVQQVVLWNAHPCSQTSLNCVLR